MPVVGPYSNRQFNPPDTIVRSTHAVTIKFNGQTIGLINSWQPQQQRQMTPIYELNVDTSGLMVEHVPGNNQNQTIQVNRYDVWNERMEQVFGTQDLIMLANQKSPFQIEEYWTKPDNSVEVWRYEGCWFSSIGRNFQSTDNRVVHTSVS
jgi:hypothetical protein